MRIRRTAVLLVAAALAGTSAPAQVPAHNDSGQRTETEERRNAANDSDLIWNLLGCLGVLGLFGFYRASDNDGYTDDPV